MLVGDGVDCFGVQAELLWGLLVAEGIWRDEGWGQLTVTSLNDKRHSRTSLHYAGAAADLRVWGRGQAELARFRRRLKKALGKDYDVVIEKDHVHLEWQPRRRLGAG